MILRFGENFSTVARTGIQGAFLDMWRRDKAEDSTNGEKMLFFFKKKTLVFNIPAMRKWTASLIH